MDLYMYIYDWSHRGRITCRLPALRGGANPPMVSRPLGCTTGHRSPACTGIPRSYETTSHPRTTIGPWA